MTCTACEPWHLPDIGAMLRAAAAQETFVMGATYIVVVDLDNAVIAVCQVADDRQDRDGYGVAGTSTLRAALVDVVGDDIPVGTPQHTTHVVCCRPGRTVMGLDDYRWPRAMLYGFQVSDTYCGELVIVTPHGWTSGRHRRAGLSPTMNDLGGTAGATPPESPSSKRAS
jgi:hypothetical protein